MLAFLLLVSTMVIAQTYGQQNNPPSAQTSSTQTSAATDTGNQKTVEGCLMKEQADFFLVPKSGDPIKLQAKAGENLDAHAGHRVKVSGSETSISAATGTGTAGGVTGSAAAGASGTTTGQTTPGAGTVGAPTQTPQTGGAGTAAGASSDLHKMATREMTVSNIQHVAASCPANWNPKVPTPSSSGTKY
ncbi:MAG: hypothetical protein ACE14L_15010 [Terriglobales bacterium]